jgi:hypothetical protein
MAKSTEDRNPHFKGPIKPSESVKHQIDVIKVTIEQSGPLLCH